MKVVNFAGQNWLITPAALAVNEANPPTYMGRSGYWYFPVLELPM